MLSKDPFASYRPITSTPFMKNGSYREIIPCSRLKPYVCCFWENKFYQADLVKQTPRLVIPDTCMDIIIKIKPDGRLSASFCTMDEKSYFSDIEKNENVLSVFGIRFFCYSAAMFSLESFRCTKNKVFFPDDFFHRITEELTEVVMRFDTLHERARETEKILIRRLRPERFNCDVMNAINEMITYNGCLKISEIAKKNVVSQRKLERVFMENIGVSPKTLSDLIRYQLVWQEVVRGGSDILDMVEKYGYTDQAHLLHDFRSRHGMTPAQAYKIAMSDFYNTK